MLESDPLADDRIQRLQRGLYLLPVLGILPALWELNRPHPNRENRRVSLLSLRLTGAWALGYAALWLGSTVGSDRLELRFLYLNGLLTSGYFLACFWFLWRTTQAKAQSKPDKAKD